MLILQRFYHDRVPGAGMLFVEGVLAALLGSVGALLLLPDQDGLVPIFLCAIASLDSVERELADNRRRILADGHSPAGANLVFTLRILALFAGQFAAFSAIMMLVDMDTLRAAFAQQLGAFVDASYQTLTFPGAVTLLGHNFGVLALFSTLALLFRHGGALLAVAWNASVWGGVFGWLARSWHAADGPSLAEAYGRVLLGVLPHMALEAAGYVLGAFAGVFLSKAVAGYEPGSTQFGSLFQSLTGMWLLAAAFVVAGTLWEAWVAESLVRWLGG